VEAEVAAAGPPVTGPVKTVVFLWGEVGSREMALLAVAASASYLFVHLVSLLER
jgi:hypothetical protein